MVDKKTIQSQIAMLAESKERILSELANRGYSVHRTETKSLDDFRINVQSLRDLRVACIMDPFTLQSYSPECRLFELTPEHWQEEIESFKPHLLFVESAWQGKDNLWYRKIAHGSKEYYALTSYCHSKKIPVVFWNKEDPVYTDVFMITAQMADFVFTTDIDCIARYKSELGHGRVYHLHFAAQPQIHNPLEKFDRKNRFCFAGAYYHRYPERAKVFDEFAEIFMKDGGLDIYDRNYGHARPEHAFPSLYNSSILGSLPSSQIDRAYKGYVYGVNMNSISQSQTMFARRVFEMLASNTVTVSNYSRGLKNYFGDLTLCTNDAETLRQNLNDCCREETTRRKYRLLGLRKVLKNHLYEDRLDYIVQKVFGTSLKRKLPTVAVIAEISSEEERERAITAFQRQSYIDKVLYLIGDLPHNPDGQNIHYLTKGQAAQALCSSLEGRCCACFSPQDYYGPYYLEDLVLTLRWGAYAAIGKANYYTHSGGCFRLNGTEQVYRPVEELAPQRALFNQESVKTLSLCDFVRLDSLKGAPFLAVDEFQYCAEFSGDSCPPVDDLILADQGLSLSRINSAAERISAAQGSGRVLLPEEIEKAAGNKKQALSITVRDEKLMISSSLEASEKQYIYLRELFPVGKYMTPDRKLKVLFKGAGDLDFTCVCVFFDKTRKKLLPAFSPLGTLLSPRVPQEAEFFQLGFRVVGKGTSALASILVGIQCDTGEKGCFLSRSKVLVLSNQYPSPQSLYRNMFVHQRVKAYKSSGQLCDVMRMNIYAHGGFMEFEGINVVEGQSQTLAEILEQGEIDTVCVHFLDAMMWEVLKQYIDRIRVIVWCHGAEIQPWWRRTCNYATETELSQAKVLSEERMAFWRSVFKDSETLPLQFVFVSRLFAEEVFEDYGISLSKDRYKIIHNCINTNLFFYEPKDSEHRKKILSVRPYTNNNYANDLIVKCIQALAKKHFFKELSFLIIGNGELFDETVKPLYRYPNVTLKKEFLRQNKIAELHKHYGICLTPTRVDSQGVSRDEAMSSGLVPVTNAVAAIPEFVDENCGILAPAEDYQAMAAGIEKLYKEPEYFERLSANAAARVRRQSSKGQTIDKEIELIWSRKN